MRLHSTFIRFVVAAGALLGVTMATAQSTSNSDLCRKKEKEYGSRFVSCSEVDWGVKPLSADYQPSNAGPTTAAPTQVKGYQNDYPGVLNTNYYFNTSFDPAHPDLKGLPLLSKFRSAVAYDPVTQAEDAGKPQKDTLENWIGSTLDPENQPPPAKYGWDGKPIANGWEGKCMNWSAWSLDPQVQSSFAQINHGILCNGIPFTKGELKEILTTLYPVPPMTTTRFEKFYKGYLGADADRVEDANVALSKLGMLGRGDLGPAAFLDLAAETKAAGRNMMMDRDPGFETWNQPISKVTDVAYRDAAIDPLQVLSSAEFEPAEGKSTAFLLDLRMAESELTQGLLEAKGVPMSTLCDLRKQVGEGCDDLAGVSLTQQVDILNRLKKSGRDQNLIRNKKDFAFLKHELIVEYGTENKFASMEADKTIVQSYTYTAVNEKNPDGTTGKVVRSNWSPSVAPLSQICANQSLADGRNKTSITNGFDLSQKCSEGKAKDPVLGKRDFFIGAVPPQNLRTYRATAMFGDDPESQKRKRAYDRFMDFMGRCQKFDAAAEFLNHLHSASLDNVFSSNEITSLNKEYVSVKNLLDAGYPSSVLSQKYQGVQGVGSLKFN